MEEVACRHSFNTSSQILPGGGLDPPPGPSLQPLPHHHSWVQPDSATSFFFSFPLNPRSILGAGFGFFFFFYVIQLKFRVQFIPWLCWQSLAEFYPHTRAGCLGIDNGWNSSKLCSMRCTHGAARTLRFSIYSFTIPELLCRSMTSRNYYLYSIF